MTSNIEDSAYSELFNQFDKKTTFILISDEFYYETYNKGNFDYKKHAIDVIRHRGDVSDDNFLFVSISFDENSVTINEMMVNIYNNSYYKKYNDLLFRIILDDGIDININDITTTECHGSKCRRNFTFEETGVWCISCHSEFGGRYDHNKFIKRKITIGDLCPENIVYIKKYTYEFDKINENKFVKKILQKILMNKMHDLEEKIINIESKLSTDNIALSSSEKEKNRKKINDEKNIMKQYCDDNLYEQFEKIYDMRLRSFNEAEDRKLSDKNKIMQSKLDKSLNKKQLIEKIIKTIS